MASTTKWVAPEAIVTYFANADIQGTTNGSTVLGSTVIDNETDLYQYIAFEIALGSLTPTGNATIDLYLVKSLDSGTNYEDSGTSSAEWLASLPLSTSTSAKRVVRRDFLIPPFKFKLLLVNSSGVTLAATGNSLRYRRYNEGST